MQQSLARHLLFMPLDFCFSSLVVFFKVHIPAPRTYMFSNTTNEGMLETNWASLQ